MDKSDLRFPTVKRTRSGGCCRCFGGKEAVEVEVKLSEEENITLTYCWLHYRRLVEGIEEVARFVEKCEAEIKKQEQHEPVSDEIPF